MSKISELSDGGSLTSTDFLIAVRSGGNVKVKMDTINVDQVDLGDNEFIRLGNSQDLTMVHTSTQSIINQAGIGDLLIQKAGATKLTINATGIDVTGSVTANLSGGVVTLGANGHITSKQSLDVATAGGRYIGSSNRGILGQIKIEQTATGADGGYIEFDTSPSGSTTPTTRMVIDQSGNLLLNTANSPTTTHAIISSDYSATGITNTGLTITGRQSGNWWNNGIHALGGSGLVFSTGTTGINGADATNQRMRIDASGNLLFSGATSNTTVLSMNTASGSDSKQLSLAGGGADSDGRGSRIRLFGNNHASLAGDADISTGNAAGAQMDLRAKSHIALSTNSTLAATIDSSQNLLVGTTDSTPYNNSGAGNGGAGIQGDGLISAAREDLPPAIFNRLVSDGNIVEFRKDGSGPVGIIGTNSNTIYIDGSSSNTGLQFAGSTIAPRDAGALSDAGVDLGTGSYRFKDLYLSGGVYLGGIGAANLLDDYEEGTWTPTVTGSTTAGSYSNVAHSANYTKVGNLVSVNMYFYGASGTGAGDLLIGGLPFSLDSTSNAVGVIQANSGLVYPTGTNEAVFQLVANATYGEVRCNKTDGSAFSKMQYPTTAGYIRISLTYTTA